MKKLLLICILILSVIFISGCTDKILGDDINKSISDYFGNIVVDKDSNLTLSDSVVITKDVVSKISGGFEDHTVIREQHTTPDGMVFYTPSGKSIPENGYLSNYDTDGDGMVDVRDYVVSKTILEGRGATIESFLRSFDVPEDSRVYDVYPDITEFRFRYLNNVLDPGGPGTKMQLFINGELVVTLSDDLNNDFRINEDDLFIQLEKDVSGS